MTPFQHILVPVDFGDAMQPGIDLAIALARRLDARISLVTAFDPSPFTTMTPFVPPIDVEPIVAALERELKKVLTKTQNAWPACDGELRRGAPHDVILDAARAHRCDLIVIGSHGRRGLARALLGSVAEKVVRLSPLPVLTVHPSRGAGDAPGAA